MYVAADGVTKGLRGEPSQCVKAFCNRARGRIRDGCGSARAVVCDKGGVIPDARPVDSESWRIVAAHNAARAIGEIAGNELVAGNGRGGIVAGRAGAEGGGN